MKNRSPWVAGFLALLAPGLGQFYNGDFRRALRVPLAIFAALLVYYSHLLIWGGVWVMALVYLSMVLSWLWGVQDSARSARASTGPRRAWYQLAGYFFGFQFAILVFAVIVKGIAPVETFSIPADSMAPALASGDYVVVDRWAYRLGKPQAGEIAIFRYPRDEYINYVKRVVGVPGDRVEMRAGALLVNGKSTEVGAAPEAGRSSLLQQAEERDLFTTFTEELNGHRYDVFRVRKGALPGDVEPTLLPEDRYYVLGDHRDRSSDSRAWGYVKLSNFVGKTRFIYYSVDPATRRIRWERIGLRVE